MNAMDDEQQREAAAFKTFDEMTNDEYRRWVVEYMMQGWIPLRMYFRLYPTETQQAVDSRLVKKQWLRGVHHSVPVGGSPWVNLIAIREWVAAGRP